MGGWTTRSHEHDITHGRERVAGDQAAGTPGRTTLAMGPPGAIQRAVDPSASLRVAPGEVAPARTSSNLVADAISGPGHALPQRDRLQQLFGRHDVSQVTAHSGPAAAAAADALGARAFATGSHVAFRDTPDLFTTAHEAAHVVQQRGGAPIMQGLGARDDEHERHADAVAERVVRGQSAEALLDRYGGGGSGPAAPRSIQLLAVAAADVKAGGDDHSAAFRARYPDGYDTDTLPHSDLLELDRLLAAGHYRLVALTKHEALVAAVSARSKQVTASATPAGPPPAGALATNTLAPSSASAGSDAKRDTKRDITGPAAPAASAAAAGGALSIAPITVVSGGELTITGGGKPFVVSDLPTLWTYVHGIVGTTIGAPGWLMGPLRNYREPLVSGQKISVTHDQLAKDARVSLGLSRAAGGLGVPLPEDAHEVTFGDQDGAGARHYVEKMVAGLQLTLKAIDRVVVTTGTLEQMLQVFGPQPPKPKKPSSGDAGPAAAAGAGAGAGPVLHRKDLTQVSRVTANVPDDAKAPRKTADDGPAKERRLGLSILNYSSVYVWTATRTLLVCDVNGSGLMNQFGLALQAYGNNQLKRKIALEAINLPPPHDFDDDNVLRDARREAPTAARSGASDAKTAATGDAKVGAGAIHNYERLAVLFQANPALQRAQTIVFGYPDMFTNRAGRRQVDQVTGHDWTATVFQLDADGTAAGSASSAGSAASVAAAAAPASRPRFLVSLNSHTAYHVEILAENVRRLLDSPGGAHITTVLMGGSAGSLLPSPKDGDAKTTADDPKVMAQYTIYTPDVIVGPNGAGVPNVLAGFGQKAIAGSAHTSVVSALVETPTVLQNMKNLGFQTIDMEFGYVATVIHDLNHPLGILEDKPSAAASAMRGRNLSFGIALLITDYPLHSTASASLAHQDHGRKARAKQQFVDTVMRYSTGPSARGTS